MLLPVSMKIVGSSVIVVTLAAAGLGAAPAHADTYLGLSVTGASDMGSLANTRSDTRQAIALGKRWGMISIEGNAAMMDATITRVAYSGKSLGVAGRLSVPVAPLLSVFGTLGFEQSWLSPDDSKFESFAGSQTLVGAGLEVKLDFMAHGSLWAGYMVRTGDMSKSGGRDAFDGQTASLALGATLGF